MMLNQPRGGHIFNIDGAGSDGRPTPRYVAFQLLFYFFYYGLDDSLILDLFFTIAFFVN